MFQINNFTQAEKYLNLFIRQGRRQIFIGKKGLDKMKYFLSFLDSPQNKLKIIHIAGTAGKGSTCYLISRLLASQGFKVGLHLSPHLTDVRERFQINNKIISKKEFIFHLNKIIPAVDKVKTSKYGSLSYFEILVGLAFYIFWQKKVDYAVIETGLGGLYDATNIVDRQDKVAVLTKIGFDHMEILGKTIEEIAYQKAMIIKKENLAVSTIQDKKAEVVIKKAAEKSGSKLIFINKHFKYHLNLIGEYQKENASLALKTVELIAKKDGFALDEKKIKKVFQTAYFMGRFDIKKIKNKTVVLDGAHNQPKMLAFTKALKKRYHKQKFHFLIAFKKGKDYENMLRYIVPLALTVTITSFIIDSQDLIHLSEKPEIIKKQLLNLNFKRCKIINKPAQAFKDVLKKQGIVVITGSMYLLGEIYKFI